MPDDFYPAMLALFGAGVEPPANWPASWDAALATLPPGPPPFLRADFVREAAEFSAISEELKTELLRAALVVKDDPLLSRVAWFLHRIYLGAPRPGAAEIWHWPFNARPLPRRAALLPALVVLAGTTGLREMHRARGIPDDVTRATLTDLEVWIRTFYRQHGYWGLQNLAWLSWHLRGELVRLGRLQFKYLPFPGPRVFRHKLTRKISLEPTDGEPVLAPGDLVIDIHIPEGGPMDFDACGAALRQAVEFLPKHLPTPAPPVAFYCCSWFLDPQYAQILPANSNIVRFLREFYLYPVPSDDREAFRRVFGEVPRDLATAPRDTALRRAMLDFKLAGGQLRYCAGFKLLAGWRWG
ncbi:MAG: hypothetical protein PCFJNLEI_02081 [Verrucomicrobiae bacterium]|nr:hypothetical protein [Verrucomicrobiae bacterium]